MEPKTSKTGNVTDHLANERTFLAWIRTAIAIMALGFVIVKSSLFIKQLSFIFSEKFIAAPGNVNSGIIGIILVVIGALISFLAYLRFKSIEKQLNSNNFQSSSLLIGTLVILTLLGGIFLVAYLLPNI